MVENFLIYFNDLNAEAQARLLKLYNISKPEEMNWDLIPIAEVPGPAAEQELSIDMYGNTYSVPIEPTIIELLDRKFSQNTDLLYFYKINGSIDFQLLEQEICEALNGYAEKVIITVSAVVNNCYHTVLTVIFKENGKYRYYSQPAYFFEEEN